MNIKRVALYNNVLFMDITNPWFKQIVLINLVQGKSRRNQMY